jgi:hypothetical protein
MFSLKIASIIERSYPELKDVSIEQIFYPSRGWIQTKVETKYTSLDRDTLEYLQSRNAEMVQLRVEAGGKIQYPDYSINALMRVFK